MTDMVLPPDLGITLNEYSKVYKKNQDAMPAGR